MMLAAATLAVAGPARGGDDPTAELVRSALNLCAAGLPGAGPGDVRACIDRQVSAAVRVERLIANDRDDAARRERNRACVAGAYAAGPVIDWERALGCMTAAAR